MRAAVNALALCAMLALTSLPTRCQQDQAVTADDEAEPVCENSPHIKVLDPGTCLYYNSEEEVQNKACIPYGTAVEVWCRGTDAKSLTISRNGKKLIPDESYLKRIMSFTSKLDLKPSEYIFKCADIETTCERSVIIMITPRFEVLSPNVETCIDCTLTYYIQYGNSMSLLCSGSDAARIVMSKDGETIPSERKNDTAIESFKKTPDLQISKYVCTDVDTTYNSSVIIYVIPTIYFQSRNETIIPYHDYGGNCYGEVQRYDLEYSDSIEVFCSGPRAVKLIGRADDGTILLTENVNEIPVFNKINITKLGSAEYTCSDREFSDYVSKVRVLVLPRMEVVSPSARLVVDVARMYSIKYGEPLEIVCSGPDVFQLTILDVFGFVTDSIEQTVNITTNKYIVKKPVWDGAARFTCNERGKNIYEEANVYVSILPAVKEFHCMSYNLQFVNCTCTGITYEANYTLSYVENGIITQICEKPSTSSLSKFCIWEYEYDDERNFIVLNFLIQSCSDVGCYNQTFHFNHLSVLKLAPPEGLEVSRTTSRGTVLWWNPAEMIFANEYFKAGRGDFLHKVQYWYSGIEPRDASSLNSSIAMCTYLGCKIELNHLCPGQFYEVRIYHKLKRAVGGFWSDPISVTFTTDIENANNIDPTCVLGPIKTKDVMRYFVQKLRTEMLPKIQPMKHEVSALQDKLDNIRKYVASIKEQDGE